MAPTHKKENCTATHRKSVIHRHMLGLWREMMLRLSPTVLHCRLRCSIEVVVVVIAVNRKTIICIPTANLGKRIALTALTHYRVKGQLMNVPLFSFSAACLISSRLIHIGVRFHSFAGLSIINRVAACLIS
jgi:hypothetical protein